MSVELKELQESARRVIEDLDLAAAEDATWIQIIELGWLWVAVPESLGGLDTGIQGAVTMHSELGRGLSTAPYLPSLLALDAICHSVLIDREGWLERITGGEFITAPLADCNIQFDGHLLNGIVTGVQSADAARHILVWSTDKKIVVLIELSQVGVAVQSRPTWDQTRRLYDVQLSGVEAAKQILLAEGIEAECLVRRLLAHRNFALAADAIGGATALLDRTVEHLLTRVQFKRPLAMFQALKHRCADMKVSIVAAEAMLFDALSRVDEELASQDANIKSMGAKLLATSMFAQVAEDCLQLHGGIGMADEHPCHLFLKRSLLSEQLGGSARLYASEIATNLFRRANWVRC